MELTVKRYRVTVNLISRPELMKMCGYKSINGFKCALEKIGFPKPFSISERLPSRVFYKIDDIIAFNKEHLDKVIVRFEDV